MQLFGHDLPFSSMLGVSLLLFCVPILGEWLDLAGKVRTASSAMGDPGVPESSESRGPVFGQIGVPSRY